MLLPKWCSTKHPGVNMGKKSNDETPEAKREKMARLAEQVSNMPLTPEQVERVSETRDGLDGSNR